MSCSELPAGRVGTLQLASAPRFSTEPKGVTALPDDDELLEDELLDEELLLEEELLDEELLLEDELLDEELLLEDELLVFPFCPPQAAMAAVNKATAQHCRVRLERSGVRFLTCVLRVF